MHACYEGGMRTEAFDFDLPAEHIALRPISPRDAARLLIVRPHPQPPFADYHVPDLPDLLSPGDALVVNDTKVIPARLHGRRLALARLRQAGKATHCRRRGAVRGGRQGLLPRPTRCDG